MALKQELYHGQYAYDVCPNCLHWNKKELVCKIEYRNKRKVCGNIIGCEKYDDSHTRPDNWEMGMG